ETTIHLHPCVTINPAHAQFATQPRASTTVWATPHLVLDVRGRTFAVHVVVRLLTRRAIRVSLPRMSRRRSKPSHLRVGLLGLREQLVKTPSVLREGVRDERQRRREPDPGLF